MLLMSYDQLEMVDFMRSYGPLLFPVSYLYHIHIGIIIADAFFAYLADVTKKIQCIAELQSMSKFMHSILAYVI